MRVILIRDEEQARKPELREEAEVFEVDIPIIPEDGLDGEIRIFKMKGR